MARQGAGLLFLRAFAAGWSVFSSHFASRRDSDSGCAAARAAGVSGNLPRSKSSPSSCQVLTSHPVRPVTSSRNFGTLDSRGREREREREREGLNGWPGNGAQFESNLCFSACAPLDGGPPLSSLPSHSGSGGGPPREIGFVSFPSDAAAAAPASA